MKATRNLLIGVILGAVIGWALGFLRFPYIEKNSAFLLGFIACLAVVLLALILLFVWKKNALLVRLISKDPTTQNSGNATRSYAVIWILVSAFIVFGTMISSFLIYKQNKLFETKTQHQNERLQEQSELIESVRRSSMVILMNDILDKVDDELKNNPGGTLSDKTIASIVAAFNYSFTPYRYWEGDSLSKRKLSPEKGQLLLLLCRKNIDSSSFDKIKHNAHFSGADLRDLELSGVNLSGSDLKGADLTDADLTGANLRKADLRDANLGGANLDSANLRGADLRRSDLRWTKLDKAVLESANLSGANLSNAQMRNADLRGANFRVAKFDGALLNEANFEGCDLGYVSLVKANLTRANLTKADVYGSNFKEAIMTETELTNANVDEDWFEKLNGWQITGAKEIRENYKIVLYKVLNEVHKYRFEKI